MSVASRHSTDSKSYRRSSMSIYYIYAYVRENNTPYYIGKGKGNRAFDERRRSVSTPIDKSKIIFIFKNLLEQEAFDLERLLIKFHGRKDNGTGILRNLTDGGEGASGAIRSKETKQKLSEVNIGKKLQPRSMEHSENISKAKKGKKGKPHSITTKEKISNATKGRLLSNAIKEKMSNSHKGKTLSIEHIQKISNTKKGKPSSHKGKKRGPYKKKNQLI